MSMSTTEDLLSVPEVIELEPTIAVGVAEPVAAIASAPSDSGPAVALVEGGPASLGGETHTLRRRRLTAAALFLTMVAGAVFLWSFVGQGLGGSQWIGRTTIALRC